MSNDEFSPGHNMAREVDQREATQAQLEGLHDQLMGARWATPNDRLRLNLHLLRGRFSRNSRG